MNYSLTFSVRFTLMLCLVITSVCRAQTPADTLDWETFEPAGYYSRGFAMYLITPSISISESSNFNNMLNQNNYPSIPNLSVNWGVGLQYRWNRLAIASDVAVNRQRRVNMTETAELSKANLVVNVDIKYYVFRNKFMALYPYGSLSSTQANLYLTQQTEPTDVNSLISENGNAAHLEHFSGGLMLGAGIDMQHLWNSESAFLTFKLGYRFSLEGAYEWESTYTTLSNAPADAFNSLFITLGLGFSVNWGRLKK